MSVFGWSLPPGCGMLPGEEPEQPWCEECTEEVYAECPGEENCITFLSSQQKAEEAEAELWAIENFDLSCIEDRVRLLKSGFTKMHPKRIEKVYLISKGIKLTVI